MKSGLRAALVLLVGLALPSAAMAQYVDIDSIIGSIGGPDFNRGAFHADDTSSVQVVRLSSFAGARESARQLHDVEDSKAQGIAYLLGQLSLNPLARTAIRNSGVSLDQIVAIHIDGGGSAVIYADDL